LVLKPLQEKSLDDIIRELLRQRIQVAAVALMHSYINPVHEQRIAERLKQAGLKHVSLSSELAPFVKLLSRAETAVVNAYLAPVIQDYLADVAAHIGKGRLHIMTSAGGLMGLADFHARDSLLSGPAGGVVGAALSGQRSGFDHVLAFDMGGTSTDVARFDGDFEYVFEHQVGDAHLVGTALAIESVAAGGGSICSFDGFRLGVGPESAGAAPGPACYGAGGPLTLTDVNLLLGRLDSERFEIPIREADAQARLRTLCDEITECTGQTPEKERILHGFLEIANERMAGAIRRVSVRKGYDPRDYALVSFGGAGGQHACAVAAKLAIATIIIPQDASLLSALGLGYAVLERIAEKQVLQKLSDIKSRLAGMVARLAASAKAAVAAEGIADSEIVIRRRIVNLRFVGQDSVLQVAYSAGLDLLQAFQERYLEVYGHLPEARDIEVESIRVIASTKPHAMERLLNASTSYHPAPDHTAVSCFDARWQEVAFFERPALQQGALLVGPAVIHEQYSTTVVEPGWQVAVDHADALLLTKDDRTA
jgi:5-oxoprolinase (ATP-hydrolysing)